MQFLGRRLKSFTQRTVDTTVDSVKDVLLKAGALLLIGTVVLWLSIFIYVAFYYAYMPSVSHTKPVHFQFQPCDPTSGVCSFPSAHVQLTKKQQLLKFGQRYKVILNLEMPESPRNKDLGMFMVCIDMRDKEATLVAHSCRSAMLHYQSELLLTIKTLLYTPMLLFHPGEEKQGLRIELFPDYEEDALRPATDVYLEIQSRHVEIYSAWLNIHAHFTGLRYLMFNWPMTSAIVGVTTNLFFLGVICALSWCHLTRMPEESEPYEAYQYFKGRLDADSDDNYEDAADDEESPQKTFENDEGKEIPEKKLDEDPVNEETTLRD